MSSAFVKLVSSFGGDEYKRISSVLANKKSFTDEEISANSGVKINLVRKIMYDLHIKGLVLSTKTKGVGKKWFTYKWNINDEEVELYIKLQKKLIKNRLVQRLEYENSSEFYYCGSGDCLRYTLQNAVELLYKCPNCGNVMNRTSNSTLKTALKKKIAELEIV